MYALKGISRAGVSVEAKVLEEISRSCVTGNCHQQEIGAKAIHLAFLLEGCTGCHTGKVGEHPRDEGSEFSFRPGGIKEISFKCHQEIVQELESARSVHRPVREGLCTSCHAPHGSGERAILKKYFPRESYGIQNGELRTQLGLP